MRSIICLNFDLVSLRLLCRLTPPLCLNFLGLIHLDSHVTKANDKLETYFTGIMGHMDVIAIISDGFNIYLPILMCFLCLATLFQFGSRFLHFMGIEQFIADDDLTAELVREGQDLVKREKNKRVKQVETGAARERWAATTSRLQNVSVQPDVQRQTSRELARPAASESSRLELLNDVEPMDYSATWSGNQSFTNQPPGKGLFDDI